MRRAAEARYALPPIIRAGRRSRDSAAVQRDTSPCSAPSGPRRQPYEYTSVHLGQIHTPRATLGQTRSRGPHVERQPQRAGEVISGPDGRMPIVEGTLASALTTWWTVPSPPATMMV